MKVDQIQLFYALADYALFSRSSGFIKKPNLLHSVAGLWSAHALSEHMSTLRCPRKTPDVPVKVSPAVARAEVKMSAGQRLKQKRKEKL